MILYGTVTMNDAQGVLTLLKVKIRKAICFQEMGYLLSIHHFLFRFGVNDFQQRPWYGSPC